MSNSIGNTLDRLQILTPLCDIDFTFLSQFLDQYIDNKIIHPKYTFKDKYELSIMQQKKFKFKDTTTIGRFIFNAFCLCEEYIDKFGYINEPMTSKVNSKFHENLSILFVNNIIDYKKYNDIVNRTNWLGGNMTNHSGLCIDYKSITMPKWFKDKKNKIYKELKEKNATGNEILEAEDKLIEEAKHLKKDTGMYKMINSGSKGSFSNNFKVLLVGRGIIKGSDGSLKVIPNDLASGNGKAEYVDLSNNGIVATYGRSMKTAQGAI